MVLGLGLGLVETELSYSCLLTKDNAMNNGMGEFSGFMVDTSVKNSQARKFETTKYNTTATPMHRNTARDHVVNKSSGREKQADKQSLSLTPSPYSSNQPFGNSAIEKKKKKCRRGI